MSEGYRVAVVGATGQVGTLMLRLLRERDFPAREIVPFASERSVGRELDGGLVVRGLDGGVDPGLRPRAVLRRRLDLGRVGAALRRRGRGGRRQLLALAHAGRRPARRQRGQPRRARLPPGDRREPELLDDAARRRPQAAPRRGRDRAPGDLHLPGRLRHRQGRRGRAARPVPRAAPRAPDRAAAGLRPPDRLQRAAPRRLVRRGRRSHRRGAQADQRDAQDPRRPRDPRLRDVRARAGAQRPLRGRQRADARAALPRARARAAERPRRA